METPLPTARNARLDVLFCGYAGPGDDGALRVGGTVSLIRDADRVIVVDPGMVPRRSDILDPLGALGVSPADVTDVVLSHHHPDHTVNVALFGEVPVHDVQAVYQRDRWVRRPAEGFSLSDSVRLLATPGHTPQDITTLVGTADGLVALTHLWWTAEGPADDPYAPDRKVLRAQRHRVLDVVDRVVPGHGAPFAPGDSTPR
jgi:glyoxylase-like metal-dependent hydrolase (beta-lactamase superfamily II)